MADDEDDDPQGMYITNALRATLKDDIRTFRFTDDVVFDDLCKNRYLEVVRKYGTPGIAAKLCGISVTQVNDYLKKDPEFADARLEALDEFRENLELVAIDRAVNGTANDVFHQGIKCGENKKYSDKMLEILLKANNPKKYSDKVQMDTTVTGGVLLIAPPAVTETEWIEASEAKDDKED